MDSNNSVNYNAGGSFETTIGKTQYEVVMNFKEDGMSMQEKALRVVKEGDSEKKLHNILQMTILQMTAICS